MFFYAGLAVANRNIIINALRLIASQRKARHGVRLYLYDGFKPRAERYSDGDTPQYFLKILLK